MRNEDLGIAMNDINSFNDVAISVPLNDIRLIDMYRSNIKTAY